ncbi:MAG: DUF3662 and FHA domain-containing protein [Antricoccus sp.]
MGVFSRFERKLENGVGGAFARVFKGQVHPAEIGRALKVDAEDNKVVLAQGRILVPNRYVVRLGRTDYQHLAEWESQLSRSLGEIVQEHLDSEGWSTHGPIKVRFARDENYRTGIFAVESSVDNQDTAPPHRQLPSNVPSSSTAEPRTQFIGATPPAPPPGRPIYQHIIVVDGPNTRAALHEGRNVIGRGSACDIKVTDTGVSRQHAEIIVTGPNAIVQDLNSTNGTLVNGRKISNQRLTHGDVVRLGHSVLVYRYEMGGEAR